MALGNQYATTAGPIVRVLRPTIAERGDRRVLEALDTIESLCEMVARRPLTGR